MKAWMIVLAVSATVWLTGALTGCSTCRPQSQDKGMTVQCALVRW